MNSVDLGRCKRIVQYLWDPEPKNDEEPSVPIWCLGQRYTRHIPEPTFQNYTTVDEAKSDHRNPTHETALGWPEAFISDFESRIWITYRSNFVPIPRPQNYDMNPAITLSVRLRSQLMDSQGFTSDTGWGCMIRSGQSLLANGLSNLFLGRGINHCPPGGRTKPAKNCLLIPTQIGAEALKPKKKDDCCPYSPISQVRRFQYIGLSSMALSVAANIPENGLDHQQLRYVYSMEKACLPCEHCLHVKRALCEQCQEPKIRVYVTNDNSNVYKDKFMSVACDDSGHIKPTLILLGTRLGIDHVTPVYWDALKAALQYPQSVGIAGGRPSASHYFIGVQGSHLFYLDPHHTRPALPYRPAHESYTVEECDTYHTRRLRRIHIKDMDPSMLLGFLIKDEADWEDWKNRVESGQGKPILHILGEMQPDGVHGREGALDEVEALDDTDGFE